MLYPEDTIFLIGSILVGAASILCLWAGSLFGMMACIVLSGAGIAAHFRARHKEKKRKAELEKERKEKSEEKEE